MIEKLYNFWFHTKFLFSNGMLFLIAALILSFVLKIMGHKLNSTLVQLIALFFEVLIISLITFFTVVLIFLKQHFKEKDKKNDY
jgi:hypothetical protein